MTKPQASLPNLVMWAHRGQDGEMVVEQVKTGFSKEQEVIYIPESHLTTLRAELELAKQQIEEWREALEKGARANERRPEDGRGGPEFVMSR